MHWSSCLNGRGLELLDILTRDPVVQTTGDFVCLPEHRLEAPAKFAPVLASFMPEMVHQTLKSCTPIIVGLCLIQSRRSLNRLCAAVWSKVRVYMTAPPTICNALRIQSFRVQFLVSAIYGTLLRSGVDDTTLEDWAFSAIDAQWSCPVGSEFHADVLAAARFQQCPMIRAPSGRASLVIWNSEGVAMSNHDKAAMWLFIMFAANGYAWRSAGPPDSAPSLFARAATEFREIGAACQQEERSKRQRISGALLQPLPENTPAPSSRAENRSRTPPSRP